MSPTLRHAALSAMLVGSLFIGLGIPAQADLSNADVKTDADDVTENPPDLKPLIEYHFDKDKSGQPPSGMQLAVIGQGHASRWQVRSDPQAPSPPNTLAQVGSVDSGFNFSAAFVDAPAIDDVDVSVRFKAISGSPAAAALIYRYQGPDTFYVLVADSDEDELTLYRMFKGKHKPIDSKQVIITAQIWHHLRVIILANTYRVYINDELVMAGRDKAILTAGRLALATPTDARVYFDDLTLATAVAIVAPVKP